MKALYCGIDLHASSGTYVVTDAQDHIVFKKRLPNDLARVLEALHPFKKQIKAMAVESTFNWYWLVDGLAEQGYPIRLANPAAMEPYEGLKDANDQTDALFVAQLLRLGILPEGYIYPKEDRPVRDLLRRRMRLVQQRTATILSLEALFARHTGRTLSLKTILRFSKKERATLLEDDAFLLFTVQEQMDLIALLAAKIKRFEELVLETAQLRPSFEKLLSIPGVGTILALTIMLETGDIHRFKKVGNYSSYCRCARAKHTSAGKVKKHNNRKNGNKYLSWAFVEAVHHAIRCCPAAQRFYQRKRAQRNGAVATKALASKWSKAAYYVMKRQVPFDSKKVAGGGRTDRGVGSDHASLIGGPPPCP
jgi:transposase